MARSILVAQVVCALLYAGPLCAAPPPPPPVAGAVGQAPTPMVEPVDMASSRPRLAAPLRCPSGKGVEELPPGERLACLEKTVDDPGAETMIARALALESAGLLHAAALSWRKMSTAGLGDVGVEAGRRANALAELERARVSSLKRGGRAAKAAFRSSLQTLNRQARAPQWPLHQAMRYTLMVTARRLKLRRELKRLYKQRPSNLRTASPWYDELLSSKSTPGVVDRCLGGGGADRVNAMTRHGTGQWIAVGESENDSGDRQVRMWRLDAAGVVRRQADFGAVGLDRALAVLPARAGRLLVIGETHNEQSGDDVLAMVIDVDLTVHSHAAHDGRGGNDHVVGAVSDGQGGAWVLVDGTQGKIHDAMLMRLSSTGKLLNTMPLDVPAGSEARALAAGGGRLYIGGERRGQGWLLELQLKTGRSKPVKAKWPGPVWAVHMHRSRLTVMGKRADERLWVGQLNRRGRLRAKALFPTPELQRLGMTTVGKSVHVWGSAGVTAQSWIGKLDRRGRVKGRWSVSAGLDLRGLASRGGKGLMAWGAARGCGRGTLDGWIRLR